MTKGLHSAQAPVRFGAYEVDFKAGELRKQGVRVKLQDQPFQVLKILLEHPGEIVIREELRQRIWPADTFVDFDQGLNNAVKRLREALGDSPENPHFIETVPRRGYRFVGSVAGSSSRIESVCVLPLENLSGDADQEYFADGLTEALTTNLAKISPFRVISRTTAMHYKHQRPCLLEIAREINVDAFIEGTVMRAGDRVRISAQLIDARSDMHLWAESYDRDIADILTLYSELASSIAREVEQSAAQLDRPEVSSAGLHAVPVLKPISPLRKIDPRTYEAYLKGRYYWNKRTPAGVKKGAEYFQEAIEKDPSYAAAYAGLADSAGIAGFWGVVCPDDGCRKGKAAAVKALEIEETAEAHASLGWSILHYDFDYSSAIKEFQRAIALNPNYATGHQWYGHCLTLMGSFEKADLETTHALELDPLSLIIHTSHAAVFWVSRKWDRAIHLCQKALELDPNFAVLHWLLAHVYQGKGTYDEAILERQRAVELFVGAPFALAELGGTYAAAGKAPEARRILEKLHDLSSSQYVSAHAFALIHTGLGEIEEAFLWLDKAYHEHSAILAWIKVDPRLDPLRADPRFDELLARMKVPLSSLAGAN